MTTSALGRCGHRPLQGEPLMKENTLPVIEQFISLDGEGPTAGELAYFVRFNDCNLRCTWCDTVYSWDGTSPITHKTPQEIYHDIKQSGIKNVTLTGGEPLIQQNILPLLQLLASDDALCVHIETNGAVNINDFREACPSEHIYYILDYKLPSSGMEQHMRLENLKNVKTQDVYKFVIASETDLQRAIEIIKTHNLEQRCQVFLSPVRELIDPLVIVDAMKKQCLNNVRLQLQLHKILWPKEMRGV